MFAVGLDVDTYNVSLFMVTWIIIKWLFAGNFIEMSPPMFSVVGIISISKPNLIKNISSLEKDKKESAGNPFTLCLNNKSEVDFDFDSSLIDSDNFISDHLKKHKKPYTDEEFGYYLAGLIEGDGYIGENRIEIAFHIADISSAYYIKKRIGYGSVLFLKNKNSVRYVLRHSSGIKKVYLMINGKLLGQPKIDQLINNNYNEKYGKPILPKANFNLGSNY
jgi:hypothetical protein